jgi:hypothetical protein
MTSRSTTGRRARLLLCSAVLLLSACNNSPNSNGGNPNGPKMTNVPGAVSPSPDGSAKLTGHFEIRQALPGENFLFSSASIGGACIVGQYPAQPQSCTQHSECALPSTGTGNGASSYCLAESPGAPTGGNAGATPPNGAGTCWIKPSEGFCLKFVGPGKHDTPPAAPPAGIKKWRVLTCLNGVPGACGGAPATPNELQHQVGPVYSAP